MTKRRTFYKTVSNIATVGSLLSLGAMFSSMHWLLDLISHFRVQYIVLLVPAFFMACAVRKTNCIMIICLAIGVHGYSTMMSALPLSGPSANLLSEEALAELATDSRSRADVPTTDSADITVFSSNLLVENSNSDAQLEIIKSVNPDVIAFQEYTNEWHAVLSNALSTEYPHQSAVPTGHAFGIALYSKFPIIEGGIERFSEDTTYVVNALLNLGDRSVRVIAVHPIAPVSIETYDLRNKTMKLIAEESAKHDTALIVMGDFNATPWTSHFNAMTKAGKLRPARAGFGLHPTWPNNFMALGIPIDHILVNSRVAIDDFDSASVKGSDHRPIWSRVRVYK